MSKNETRSTVLIAEDEAIVAVDLRRQLEDHAYVVAGVVGRSDEVIAAVQLHRPSVVLMDVRLRGPTDGVTLAEEIFVCEDTPVVFLSAFSDRDIVARAAGSGAYGYLTKPVTMPALLSTLEMAIQKHADLRRRRTDADWLGRAIDAVDLAVIGLEGDGVVRYMNQTAVALAGRSMSEVRGLAPAWTAVLTELPAGPAREGVAVDFGTGGPIIVRARRFPLAAGGSMFLLQVK